MHVINQQVGTGLSGSHHRDFFHQMDRQKDKHNKKWHYSEWQAKSLALKYDHSACVSKQRTLPNNAHINIMK